MAIEVLCCWLTNHVGAANEISAMHRNAVRFYCGVYNDRISRPELRFTCSPHGRREGARGVLRAQTNADAWRE